MHMIHLQMHTKFGKVYKSSQILPNWWKNSLDIYKRGVGGDMGWLVTYVLQKQPN